MHITPVACGCLIKQHCQPILAGNCRVSPRKSGGETIPLWNYAVGKGILKIVSSGWKFPHLVLVLGTGVRVNRLYPKVFRVQSYILINDLVHVGQQMSSHLFSSIGHLRSCCNWEMLVGSLGPRPDTQRMARFCILSKASMSFARGGPIVHHHTQRMNVTGQCMQYSSDLSGISSSSSWEIPFGSWTCLWCYVYASLAPDPWNRVWGHCIHGFSSSA